MDAAAIEKLMELMVKHQVDELTVGGVCIKKSRHRVEVPAVAENERALLDKHLEPLPNEPWLSIDPAVADAWAEGRAVDADPSGPAT